MASPASSYATQLISKQLGYPLWEPDPGQKPGVELADVGYISEGSFIRLFNASKERTDTSNHLGIPEGYVPLHVREQDILRRTPLPKKPECISSEGVSGKGVDLGLSGGYVSMIFDVCLF